MRPRLREVLVVVLLGVSLLLNYETIKKVARDESHTRTVQVQGGPPAVCLREALAAAAPLLAREPAVEGPLNAYVYLQRHRYPGVRCPVESSTPPVAKACVPPVGHGTMGVCTPPAPPGAKRFSVRAGEVLIPDVSEYQACALHSEAIFRLYEAGTNREDSRAACHARELRRLHAWSAAYFFTRPPGFGAAPSCAGQVARVVAILHAVGGVTGPVIVDAEVPLPAGFVTCLVRGLQRARLVVVTYTAPGTWPGGVFVTRVWVAAYPDLPGCFENACPFVAHQFSDDFDCRGVVTDCSLAEGILSIRQAPAKPRRATRQQLHEQLDAAYRRRNALRGDLTRHKCRTVHGSRAYRLCPRWGREGRLVDDQIRRLHHEGIY